MVLHARQNLLNTHDCFYPMFGHSMPIAHIVFALGIVLCEAVFILPAVAHWCGLCVRYGPVLCPFFLRKATVAALMDPDL